MDITRLHVGARYSEAAIHNGTVYLAGMVAADLTQDIDGQTRQVLADVDRFLAEAGSDKSRILMCQIFLLHRHDYDRMNVVYDAWLAAGHAPPRATVIAPLARPDILIEVVVTAALTPVPVREYG